jgi:hypothetical protein
MSWLTDAFLKLVERLLHSPPKQPLPPKVPPRIPPPRPRRKNDGMRM